MWKYEIYAFCDKCSVPHPIGVRLDSKIEPENEMNVGDVYSGQDVPDAIASFKKNSFPCPKTGQTFKQEDNYRLFMVLVDDRPVWDRLKERLNQIARKEGANAAFEVVCDKDDWRYLEIVYDRFRIDSRKTIDFTKASAILKPENESELLRLARSILFGKETT